MTFTVVIADDHSVLRARFRALLMSEADFDVIGEAADGDAALSVAQALKPDVLLADTSMPGPNGIEITRKLRGLDSPTRVLILTMHEDRGLVREALEAGAKGYLPKRRVESELVRAVRLVAKGGVFVPPECLPSDEQDYRRQHAATFLELSLAQLAVLRLIVQGSTTAQIASELQLAQNAVADPHTQLAEKPGAYSRAAFVRYAHAPRLM